jgi:hypothetical protein
MSNSEETAEKKATISIGNLASQVRDFWAATGVPIVELMLSILVLSWCVFGSDCVSQSITTAIGQTILSHSQQSLPTLQPSKSIFELFGLSTILPIAGIVVLLGVAQGLSAFLRMLGGMAPIHFAYRVEILLLRHLPLGTLESAWARLDVAEDLRMLSERLDHEVNWSATNVVASQFFRGSLQLQPVIDRLDSTRRFVAGLLAAGILVWLLHEFPYIHRVSLEDAGRLGTLIAVGVAALIYLNVNFLHAARLYHYRKFADFVAWKDDDSKGPPELSQLAAAAGRIKGCAKALPEDRTLVARVTRNSDLEFDMIGGRSAKEDLAAREKAIEGRIEELRRRSTQAMPPVDPLRRR